MVIPGWQMAIHGQKGQILAGYCHCNGAHPGWLKELHGKSFIWLAEQRKHRFCRVSGSPFGCGSLLLPRTFK
jgi:hypothetical protein